ncbi:MAG: ATPase, T2SS/T4P/T4SS family, partial [Pseudomonadota bacterium]
MTTDRAALARTLDLPYHADVTADAALFELLPVETASRLAILPLTTSGDTLTVAVSDPLDLTLERRLASITGRRIALAVAEPEAIAAELSRVETSRRVLDRVSAGFKPELVREAGGREDVVDLESLADQSGMVQLTNSILMAALQRQASDVHIEVGADRVQLKYRVDGVLYPATDPIDASHHNALVSRIKVMADLDIAERRVPQDGRFRLRIEGRDVDFRVSVLPTQWGEDVVIRILDKSHLSRLGQRMRLDDLGLAPG